MEYLENSTIKDFCLDKIIDKLDDYEDIEEYGADLGYKLFEGENADGVIFYSTYESKEWIKEHFEDLDEVMEELNFQFGSDYMSKFNPFSEPDRFVLIVVLEVSSYLLSRCKTIDDNWNNSFKLTKAKIKKIKQELEEQRN